MIEVTKEDANNYCRVLRSLEIEDDSTDPVAMIDMLRSWNSDANLRADRLANHLRQVIEIARTWQPDYATKMDRDTLDLAAADIQSDSGVANAITFEAANRMEEQASELNRLRAFYAEIESVVGRLNKLEQLRRSVL